MLDERQTIIIFIIGMTIFIVLLIGFIIYVLIHHQRRHISHQKDIEELRAEFEKDMLKTQMEIQEDTFTSISREIHDNIGLSLTLAKLNLNTVEWRSIERSREQVTASVGFITKAIVDLSNISKILHTDFLKDQGLLKGVELEIQRIRQLNKHTIHYDLSGNDTYLPQEKELMTFRVIQEILANCIKHADAQNIWITIHYNANDVSINIRDDGKGFELQQVIESPKSGTGLKNIKKRASYIGGTCSIKSVVGKGTTINLQIPY